MKRFFLLAAAMMIGIMLLAQTQTQQGYVKTKGRMDAKGNLIPGHGLKGATVSIKGRTTVLVNTDDGAFSFPVPEAQFRLDSVRKKGYQLVDMDALGKIYKHSSNPLYLVMETPEQQLQDQLVAERKIRRTLTDQLHQREDEIEALKEQQKISDEEYRLALQKLYEDTDQNEQLVKDMVERYSKIDYDQLDEFDQRISELILNGELIKADSMLRTKGDINVRVEQYRKHEAINAKEKEELSQRQEQLEQSEALALQERDDIANDCYRKFEIFKMQHLNDSAAYYIELRASLDPYNIDWRLYAAEYIYRYLARYDDVQNYCKSVIKMDNNYDFQSVSKAYIYMGIVNNDLANYKNAEIYLDSALSVLQSHFESPNRLTALVYNKKGIVFQNKHQYDKAYEYLFMALNLNMDIFGENSPEVAGNLSNIGGLMQELGEYEDALVYYNKALTIFQTDADKFAFSIAGLLGNIGGISCYLEDFQKGLYYDKLALSKYLELVGKNHPNVAESYHNIATTFGGMQIQDSAIYYYSIAWEIRKNIFGENNPKTIDSYSAIGGEYYMKGDFEKAKTIFQESLIMLKKTIGLNNTIAGFIYAHLSDMAVVEQHYDDALQFTNNLIEIYRNIYGENHPNYSIVYNSLADIYDAIGDYQKAYEYYSKSYNILKSLLPETHPAVQFLKETVETAQSKLKEQENNQIKE